MQREGNFSERIVLENEKLSAEILPQLGGKLSSVYWKPQGFELAAPNTRGIYRLPGEDADFSEFDASGLDDAFPSIDGASVRREGKTVNYPDHGEIWSHPFAVLSGSRTEAALEWESSRFEYRYEKRVRLEDDSLLLDWKITNVSDTALPCIWTFHGLMRYEEDMRLILPSDLTRFRNVMDSPLLGEAGRIYERKNDVWDFERVPKRLPETALKFYGEGRSREGVCGLVYPTQKTACIMTYDADRLPWLGVWITAGGYRGDYNVALEPSNGFYDDIFTAEKNGCLYALPGKETLAFSMRLKLESLSD
ncbi:MAG TPA: DUF5107 domain-containing protein [Candidatus Eisenbergiella merdavium]|uniref:DUF5107 domain-containing protein n=1 Tax=Candidatus Eisenbergiella merdavium TaxID=2838551 RepID=A0A9D2NGY8_9FIRM|nr:DUF5107 domain-containing protein [Candidatus Eisenbergiella merdavium]